MTDEYDMEIPRNGPSYTSINKPVDSVEYREFYIKEVLIKHFGRGDIKRICQIKLKDKR